MFCVSLCELAEPEEKREWIVIAACATTTLELAETIENQAICAFLNINLIGLERDKCQASNESNGRPLSLSSSNGESFRFKCRPTMIESEAALDHLRFGAKNGGAPGKWNAPKARARENGKKRGLRKRKLTKSRSNQDSDGVRFSIVMRRISKWEGPKKRRRRECTKRAASDQSPESTAKKASSCVCVCVWEATEVNSENRDDWECSERKQRFENEAQARIGLDLASAVLKVDRQAQCARNEYPFQTNQCKCQCNEGKVCSVNGNANAQWTVGPVCRNRSVKHWFSLHFSIHLGSRGTVVRLSNMKCRKLLIKQCF